MGASKRFSARLKPGSDPGDVLIAAQAAVANFAAGAGLAQAATARLSVMVEEVLSNALRHGMAQKVRLHLRSVAGGIALTFEDDGAPFDPTRQLAFKGPDPQTGGGVGLALLNAWGHKPCYARIDGTNRLRVALSSEG